MSAFRSVVVWTIFILLIIIWYPIVGLIRVFERDPAHYTSGRFFRFLGPVLMWVNPSWKLHISGYKIANPRNPYVIVGNHQSMVDIPIIACLPGEMKWLAKQELFKTPLLGRMMSWAGDIRLNRSSARSGVQALMAARKLLENKCSVVFFPEGTRTEDGRVRAFNDGAFHLAIKSGVPILPIVLEGSGNCIAKNSWKFGPPSDIMMKVLPPFATDTLSTKDASALQGQVRNTIIEEIARMRGLEPREVDGLLED